MNEGTPLRKESDNVMSQKMDVDMVSLNKQVNKEEGEIEDNGSSEEDREDDSNDDESSEDEEIMMEEEANARISKETNLKLMTGTVINSISVLLLIWEMLITAKRWMVIYRGIC